MVTVQDVRRIVAQEMAKLERRQRGSTRMGTLNALDNEEGMARGQLELSEDEQVDGVELIMPPGVSSRPEGAEVLVFAVGGDPQNLVGIPYVRGQRLTGEDLEPGETALYIGTTDQVVRLKTDGSVLVQSGTNGATILLKADGNVVVTPSAGGQIYLGQDGAVKKVALADDVDTALSTIRATFNAHVHAGVTVGPGSTAVTPSLIAALPPTGATKIRGV